MKSLAHSFSLLTVTIQLVACGEWSTGIPSSYLAEDYDPRLTVQASSAVPLIDAIKRYQADQSKLPSKGDDLKPFVATDPHAQNMSEEWHYIRNSDGYRLYRKVGWDASLSFVQTKISSHWVFDPGDGRPDKQIILTP